MTGFDPNDGFPEADGLPERIVGVKPAVRFDCPACGESLRMRPGSAGRAIDCPACGAGLILSPDAGGTVTASPVGADRKGRRAPLLPLALGGVGLACAAAAGWIVLTAGDRGEAPDPAPESREAAPVIAEQEAPGPAPGPVPPAPVEDAEPEVVAAKPRPAEEPEPPPNPAVMDNPARPPVLAPGPSADIAARRLARRLDAEVAGFRMTRPAPLAQAIEDLEDLLRVRVRVEAGRSTPVLAEFADPVTVRAILEEFARQAGVRVKVGGTEVRLTDP